MTVFESKAILDTPVNEVYRFLADMNNHKQLMPDSISGWVSTTDEARFSIQNMASLALQVQNRVEGSEIIIVAIEQPPFDLELKWQLSAIGDTTEVTYTISAQLSMMMKMLAGGPLQKLADHEVQSLNKVLV
jgi:carbon monoxide dehydrogenase subunit G